MRDRSDRRRIASKLLAVSMVHLASASCPHNAAGLLDWHSPSTWPDRVVPKRGANVNIPFGKSVLLRSSPSAGVLGKVTIPPTSTLVLGRTGSAGDSPILFNSTGIDVRGRLVAGSPDCPIGQNTPRVEITLHGSRGGTTPINEARPMSHKGIAVTGTLDLHGAPLARSWTRLSSPVAAGATSVTLQDAVDWPEGGEVLITSTALKDSRDWHRNEIRTLSSRANAGKKLFLSSRLTTRHAANSDYAAEVAYLTRSIVVQGAEGDSRPTNRRTSCTDSSPDKQLGSYTMPCPDAFLDGYGAHVVAMGTAATLRVSSVELRRVGQTNVLGRYPLHLHLMGDAGQRSYVTGSSIHESYYRCVALHGTNGALLDDNVAYDATGHCFYLEDGTEERNTLSSNLAAHVHFIGVPARGGAQFLPNVYANAQKLTQPADTTASGFYIANAYNIIINNAASGGWAGFAFPHLERPIGTNTGAYMSPQQRPVLAFDGNSGHSSAWWWGGAGVIYVGGKLVQQRASDPTSLLYNPGRGTRHDTCKMWTRGKACGALNQLFLRFTNTKVFLSANNAFSNWGPRSEIVGFSFHDLGMSANLLGVHWMSNGVMACRTGEDLLLPCAGCENDPVKAAAVLKDMDGTGFGWYDTGMQHILTDITFRRCGVYESSRAPSPGCGNGNKGCQYLSSVFKFNSGSDRFVPQMLQATKRIKYESCGRHFHFSWPGRNNGMRSSLAERLINWYDADGTASDRPGATIMGAITADNNGWWNMALGDRTMSVSGAPWNGGECTYSAEGPMVHCNAAPADRPTGSRAISSFFMQWKPNQRNDVGGAICDRNKPCLPEGSVRHWGYAGSLPLTRNTQVTGPSGGFGWHIRFNAGAPKKLQFTEIQQLKSSTLLISIAYPRGVRFTITARAASWCSTSRSRSCKHVFHRVSSIDAVRRSLGDAYFVDGAGILYLRLVQPLDGATGTPNWVVHEWPRPPFSRAGISIPTKSSFYEHIEIATDCAGSGYFCSGAVTSTVPKPCAPGWRLKAYDRCCSDAGVCVGPEGYRSSLSAAAPPPPQLALSKPPPPPQSVGGVACSTLTRIPAGETCNQDFRRRTATACPKYSFMDSGVLKQCWWDRTVGKCQQWGANAKPCVVSKPPPPPPQSVEGVACSTLTRIPAGETCNKDWRRRTATACPKYSFMDSGVVKQCWWDRTQGKCQQWGAKAKPCVVSTSGPLLCSTLAATRTNTRDLNPPQWCSSDPANRNSRTGCAKFYSETPDGALRTCEYAGGQCTMATGTTCVEDRSTSSPPLCSKLVATRKNVRHLDPPVWCNAVAHRNPTTCATLYGPTAVGSKQLAPCVYNRAADTCKMDFSLICIEDRN
jgi:hypothetical protein